MAASGSTAVSLYFSTTAATAPIAGNLVAGELAINTLDEKIYFKNSSGVVKMIASTASGTVSSVALSGGTTGLTTSGGPITTTGTITLAGTLAIANGGTGLASVGTAGNVLTSTGSAWTSSPSFVSGMIMLWSGSIVSIPTGWLICDGTNSTPDLRDRFVVGAGTTYAVNATGGSANAVVPSHTHTATDSGHTHTQTGYTSAIPQSNGSNQYPVITPISLTTGTGFANITVSTTGVSPTNANLPPYLALAYIMKS